MSEKHGDAWTCSPGDRSLFMQAHARPPAAAGTLNLARPGRFLLDLQGLIVY